MAIAIVQSAHSSNPFTGVTSGTCTVTLSAITSGNAVVICWSGANSTVPITVGTVTDNRGNTYTTGTFDNTTTEGQGIYVSTNITNGPTTFNVPFTCTTSSPTFYMIAYEVSGVAASPIDVGTLLTATSFATTFNKTFTTAQANEYGFAILSDANGTNQAALTQTSGPPTWTADFSALGGAASGNSQFASVALPNSGTNHIAGSTTSGDIWNISIVTLQQGSSPPPSIPLLGQILM